VDLPVFLGVVASVAVIVLFAIQGWWLLIAALSVVSAVSGFLAWRAGLPFWPSRDD
jgi:hypothetical protein